MGFNCGIVGLPNVGKSTIFNALTATAAAESANYPFCTIEPNVGRIAVPDERLAKLAEVASSKSIIPTHLEFVDIAGIVKGASKGEGLGNKFLANIRETDAIIHVVRCFDNDDVVHVTGRVDPLSDIDIIETELLLADLESVEGRIPALEKKAKIGDKSAIETMEILRSIYEVLKDGRAACEVRVPPEKAHILKGLQLITTKPVIYVCNVAEGESSSGNRYTDMIVDRVGSAKVVIISAAIESEIAVLDSEEEKREFIEGLGLPCTGLSKVIRSGYDLLGLFTYFTVGPKEARSWSINAGIKAPAAAGVIHTDFERGFICAETVSWMDYVECGGEQGAKQRGKMRLEGRDYVVQDGDVMHFRFNV
ncbi:MAG: redox-regulated ATPase YchF [Holosporales bacterium]|jgi:GTP-binding protein YchF|nr:redox-regulated ATPase YchF [Holosporales bacterium]